MKFGVIVRALGGAVVLTRLGRALPPTPPLTAVTTPHEASVVIPARDEARRLPPLLSCLAGAPDLPRVRGRG